MTVCEGRVVQIGQDIKTLAGLDLIGIHDASEESRKPD